MIEMDYRQLNRALEVYGAATKKDLSTVVDRACMNIGLQSARLTTKAEANVIRELPKRSWWPAFIAKQFQGRKFTRKDAQAMSKKIIGARVRAVNFVRSGWLVGARILAARLGKPLRSMGKKSFGTARPSTSNWNPVATITNSAEGIDKVGVQALQAAVNVVAADMYSYGMKKLAETARKHSAKV